MRNKNQHIPEKAVSAFAESLYSAISAVSNESLFLAENFSSDPGQLSQGRHLFDPTGQKINPDPAEKMFNLLLDIFAEHLPQYDLSIIKLRQAASPDTYSPEDLLNLTLRNDHELLNRWSQDLDIDIEFLEFFSLYLARPFRQYAAQILLRDVVLEDWRRGYCPACGHWSVLATLPDNQPHRQLFCCCCNSRWPFDRIGCAFCLNRQQDSLGYLTVDGFSNYRIYFCQQCNRYLKHVLPACHQDKTSPKTDKPQKSHDFDINYDCEFLNAGVLDQAAMSRDLKPQPLWPLSYSLPTCNARE